MSNIKTYSLELDALNWKCIIEVDHDFIYEKDGIETTILGLCRDALHSLPGGINLIVQWSGDVISAYLQALAENIIRLFASHRTICAAYEDLNEIEGLLPIDGSMGIKLIENDWVEFTGLDWKVKEVQDV